jgi:glycerol-1-phosphatase
MEGLLPKLYGQDAVEIPGARPLLNQLIAHSAPWAIVTSGTVPLVGGWLGVLDLPRPSVLVTAESVANGKPDPTCYVMGQEQLGLANGNGAPGGEEGEGAAPNGVVRNGGEEKKDLLVLEDSPAGIKAGKAAGCRVLGLVTSHTLEQVKGAEPDWVVKDLRDVKVVDAKDGKVMIEIVNILA